MNIQIFGKKKCFDTKKAERWFKERRIKFQQIDLVRFGMSGGEFDSVLRAVGGVDALIDWSVKSPEIDLMRYTDDKRAKEDKLFDHPELMKTPIVRNGRQATVGYSPEVWQTWEETHSRRSADALRRFLLIFSFLRLPDRTLPCCGARSDRPSASPAQWQDRRCRCQQSSECCTCRTG